MEDVQAFLFLKNTEINSAWCWGISVGLQIQRVRIYELTCEVRDHEMEYTQDDHHNKTN